METLGDKMVRKMRSHRRRSRFVFQVVDVQLIEAAEEQQACHQGDDLRQREGIPHIAQADLGEQIGGRQNDYQLTQHRNEQAVFAPSHRLEDGGEDDAEGCGDKA